jgi:hypothetical protein
LPLATSQCEPNYRPRILDDRMGFRGQSAA